MRCTRRSVFSREPIEIQVDRTITHLDPGLGPAPDDATWLAPGFIDLQVNGFAGADYNSPATSLEALAESLRAASSTGVTRIFPTIITNDPDQMLAALRNLARAREALPEGDAME